MAGSNAALPERVWLLRHAETATPTVFHGAESDEPLSELGHRQAAAVAEWFKAFSPTAVVSSNMQRAKDTASPIATACRIPHTIEPTLHERRVGELCGTSFSMSEGPWAETVRRWSAGELDYTTRGAESYAELRERVLGGWQRAIAAHPGERLVIVAHGVVCKILLLSLLPDRGPADWIPLGRVPNVSMSELTPLAASGLWIAERLLFVPEPVARLSDGLPTGVGPSIRKSEA